MVRVDPWAGIWARDSHLRQAGAPENDNDQDSPMTFCLNGIVACGYDEEGIPL